MKKILGVFILGIISLGLLAQTDVLPPQLHLPANNADDQMPNTELDWYPVSGIGTVMYEIQLDTNSMFSNAMVFETNESAYRTSQLTFNTEYFWRVRAIDDLGTSDWSETRNFVTFIDVDLDGPDDGDTGIEPNSELEWKGRKGSKYITGVTFFDFQVSLNPDFNTLYQAGSLPYAENTIKYMAITQYLMFDTTYYWRVRARHQTDTTIWSEVWSFSTLAMPTLVNPANGATDQMLNAQLKWNAISGVFSYVYDLCIDPTFSLPCTNIADSNIAVSQGLSYGKTYYWRVKGIHSEDTSDWSETRSFTTINTVNLVSPENGAYVSDLYPELQWQAQTGTGSFKIYVDVDENFTNPEINTVAGTKSSFNLVQPAILGTTYYWKVKAFISGDSTEFSETRHFISGEAPQGIHNNSATYNMSIYPNPCDNVLNLKFFAKEQIDVNVSILNLLGQLMKESNILLSQGINQTNMDVSGLESGIYMIRIKSGDSFVTQRFIINR